MYRLLSASKDSYITNKYIAGTRVTSSNVGQAGTLDLFKLYNETTVLNVSGTIVEQSRLLIKFDYSELQALTGSRLDFATGSFQAIIHLKDVYGGQTTPSNFKVEAFPLAKDFDEGRGHDVVSYRDLDAVNWATASLAPVVTWSQPGAAKTGSLGETADIFVSGNLGTTSQSLAATQTFKRGDEDLRIDVTPVVSASLAGIIPNNGFRLSFTKALEEDTFTYFVKRFGSRHTFNKQLHPKLIVKYDGDRINDPGSRPRFNVSQSLFVYNTFKGNHENFVSRSQQVTGQNSLKMKLLSSHSVSFPTSSYSPSHNKVITYTTKSTARYSQTFSGSQLTFGSIPQTGIYYAPFILSTTEDTALRNFLSGAKQAKFEVRWLSNDETLLYAKDFVTFEEPQGDFSNAMQQNLVVNITNLQDEYNTSEHSRLRIFASDYNLESPSFKVPTVLRSVVIPDMRWRLVKPYTGEVVIPWDKSTRMSTDQDGMYFDMYFKDLDVNQVYEFELLIRNSVGRDLTITNKGFRFKVVP